LYVNVALRDPLSNAPANTYESGGPTDNVIPIWKVAAPSISLLAPDIYMPESEKALKIIELYDRPDNALFVPEIGSGEKFVRYFYPVLAHGGIGFSPFGIDDNGNSETKAETETRLAAIAQEYAMVAPMMREMAKWCFEGKIKSVVEREDHDAQTVNLGLWEATVTFGKSGRNTDSNSTRPFGKAMFIQLTDNEFILTGTNCHFTFKPLAANAEKSWQYLKVEEGKYENGTFKMLRIRNGDETDWGGPSIGAVPVLLRVSLTTR
jgi:hypothetical protein